MSPFLAEMLGTMIFVFLGNAVVAGVLLTKSKAENAGWLVIAMGWGLAGMVAIYTVGGISGAHINPAMTIALATAGLFPWSQVPMYILAQMIGGFLASVMVYLQYLPHWKETKDPVLKLAVFCTGPAIPHTVGNLISEIIATFFLVFGALVVAGSKISNGISPFVIGFLIVGIVLSLGGTTGTAMNPARDLATRFAHFLLPIPGKGGSDWQYSWIPVVGSILGGILGAVFYQGITKGSGTTAVLGLCIFLIICVVISQLRTKKKIEYSRNQTELL
jgi:glycerol uptake facilitator protein